MPATRASKSGTWEGQATSPGQVKASRAGMQTRATRTDRPHDGAVGLQLVPHVGLNVARRQHNERVRQRLQAAQHDAQTQQVFAVEIVPA